MRWAGAMLICTLVLAWDELATTACGQQLTGTIQPVTFDVPNPRPWQKPGQPYLPSRIAGSLADRLQALQDVPVATPSPAPARARAIDTEMAARTPAMLPAAEQTSPSAAPTPAPTEQTPPAAQLKPVEPQPVAAAPAVDPPVAAAPMIEQPAVSKPPVRRNPFAGDRSAFGLVNPLRSGR